MCVRECVHVGECARGGLRAYVHMCVYVFVVCDLCASTYAYVCVR